MTNRRHYRGFLLLPALLITGIPTPVGAQSSPVKLDNTPIIMGRKQAAKLLVVQQKPEYPAVAKVNYLQGNVQLELTVNGAGKVAKVHVLQGNPVLAESALKATRQWVYHPFETPSGPSGFITTVELRFKLDNWSSESADQRGGKDFLTPQQAEQDFMRQVKPPKVVRSGAVAHQEDVVHMRLLVNEQGEVDDMETSPMSKDQFDAARDALRSWTFQPAHWGTLPVASYLNVDIPVSTPPLSRTASTPTIVDQVQP